MIENSSIVIFAKDFFISNVSYVWVNDLISDTDRLKESILRFTSSELTSHAANFIGLSILMFSYLTFVADRFPPVQFSFVIDLACRSTWNYMIIFLVLWLLTTGIIFALARLAYYGQFAYRTINIISRQESLRGLYNEISEDVTKQQILKAVPVAWFKSGIARLSIGFALSFVLGLIVASILFLAFFTC